VSIDSITIELAPDERGRLDAESRRRGITASEVILDFVRSLPGPHDKQRTFDALARLRTLRESMPPISEADIQAAIDSSREELERRGTVDSE
jgi:hypothetical protein